MIFTAPPAANAIRTALAITDPTTPVLINDTRTHPAFCDYTNQVADIEVRAYGADLYETLYVTAANTNRAITDLTTDYDVDHLEIVVNLDWVHTLTNTAAIAA